jgi:hypothetical protein
MIVSATDFLKDLPFILLFAIVLAVAALLAVFIPGLIFKLSALGKYYKILTNLDYFSSTHRK